jgi:hypothetical protein
VSRRSCAVPFCVSWSAWVWSIVPAQTLRGTATPGHSQHGGVAKGRTADLHRGGGRSMVARNSWGVWGGMFAATIL